ncbi:hypothetical protein FRC11_013952 [Ceratobasidium sp. 423]|nr:hypothetical protein FRC11_013952 [Ceratobasidium sp. 423]
MQPDRAHEVYSDVRHSPKLPSDVTYLIAQFSSFEALASLEIHLHKPTQLVRLCKSHRALSMLSGTKSLFLEEAVFYIHLWVDFVGGGVDVSNYLITVLRAAASLLRLQIFYSPARSFVSDHIIKRLRSMSSDPTFLPKLEVLIGTWAVPLEPLHKNRPVKFMCSAEDSDKVAVEIYPSLARGSTTSLTVRSMLLEQAQNLSVAEIGSLMYESKASLPAACSYFYFTVRFPEEIRTEGRPPIPDLLDWLREVIRTAKISSSGIKWLNILFDPDPSRLSASAQYTIVTGLYELLPQLERAHISTYSITWSRHKGPLEGSQDPLPLWTSEPNIFTIGWWLDVLHLSHTSTPTQEEAEQIAGQLRKAIGRRYPPAGVPSIESLMDRLVNRNYWRD